MSTFVTSKGTRCQHVSPKCPSRPYKPSPARREAIHGRVQSDLDEQTPAWAVIIMVGFFVVVAWLCASKGWWGW